MTVLTKMTAGFAAEDFVSEVSRMQRFVSTMRGYSCPKSSGERFDLSAMCSRNYLRHTRAPPFAQCRRHADHAVIAPVGEKCSN